MPCGGRQATLLVPCGSRAGCRSWDRKSVQRPLREGSKAPRQARPGPGAQGRYSGTPCSGALSWGAILGGCGWEPWGLMARFW